MMFDRATPGDRSGPPGAGSSRGVSNVLGLVLVLGMVVTASLIIVVVGASSFSESQSTVSMESAVTAMEQLNNELLEASSQPGERISVTMPSMQGADLRVEDAGWINVSLINRSSEELVGNQTTRRVDLGKVVYERDGQSVVLQAGGVYRTNAGSESAATLTQPPFEYQFDGGEPTASLRILQLENVAIDGNTVTVTQDSIEEQPLSAINPIEDGEAVRITVHSEFYREWYEQFAAEPSVTVEKFDSNNTAQLTLPGPPEPESASNALSVPGAAILGGNLRIASYDSTQPGGSGRVGIGQYVEQNVGDVVALQDVTASGSVTINGSLYVNGSYNLGGDATIKEDVYANGTASSGSVEGSLYARKRVTVDTSMDGDVVTYGPVYINQSMTGNVHAGGDVFVNAEMDGDIITTGNVTVHAPVNGDIHAGGDVILDGGPANGNITAGGDVIVRDTWGNGIGGNVNVSGDLRVTEEWITVIQSGETLRISGDIVATGDGEKFAGDIYARGNVTINGSQGELTTDGDLTVAGSIDITQINGDVTNVSASAIVPPADPRPPREPNLGVIQEKIDFPNVSKQITDAVSRYRTNNDNSTVPGFSSMGGNSVHDTLPAGDYYYDGDLTYSGSPSLTFDTTGGDINLVVEGDFDGSNLDIDVKGNNEVHMYVTGSVDLTGRPNVSNSEGRGDQFWLYAGDETTHADISNEFYGVILSTSTVDLNGGARVYGAILSQKANVDGGQKIYFDEALLSANREIEPSPGSVRYVRISTVSVGSD